MTHFEFLSVFLSIILALGVSGVLSGWGEQIRFRDEVDGYPLHTGWGILYLLAVTQGWWGLWRLRDRTDWTFADNLILIIPYLFLALLAYILTPSISNGQRDVKGYYYRNAPWFFGIAAVYVATLMVTTKTALGQPFLDPANSIRVAGIALMVALARSKNERFHHVALIMAYLLLIAWILMTLAAL